MNGVIILELLYAQKIPAVKAEFLTEKRPYLGKFV